MKTNKMSLANVQGKLSRTEMKNIMAGDAPGEKDKCTCNSTEECPQGKICSSDCEKGTTDKNGHCTEPGYL